MARINMNKKEKSSLASSSASNNCLIMFIEQQKQVDNYVKKQVLEAPKQEYKNTINQIKRLRFDNMLINHNNRLSNMTTLLLRTFLNKML